jgi:hypothetical protein
MEVSQSVVSSDRALRVTLESFDQNPGEGRVRIEELQPEKGKFYVLLKYGEAGEMRIDYKTYDVHKTPEHHFFSNPKDTFNEILIVRVKAD